MIKLPRIGVTGQYSGSYAGRLFEAEALPIPVTARNLAELDGILFTGGLDIDPRYYGQKIKHKAVLPDTERDALEFPLITQALVLGLPTLGICRGMQLLNVALGGKLIQHVPKHMGTSIKHDGGAKHPICIRPHTYFSYLAPEGEIVVNSYHHQAIHNAHLGKGLIASAIALDGTIEVVEGDPKVLKGWVLGVQFHPERVFRNDTLQYEVLCNAIFDDFVAQCRK